ncbi:hypothetical protein Q8G38_00140 [Halomonas venusta]|uniref:hypothetical protein n=1 Tax=Vreelandella venusta TaxID=44935 RepID=UPI00295E5764|nr:hypothetical protein [Halomonas venusta]MDW0357718.1 hypothetical protein [Halomonas venusta]
MSLEQAVVQLEQTNAALQEEVVRFRDAAMGLNNIWPTITEGRQNTADGKYFSVPGNGAYMRLYRRNGSSSSLIADFPDRNAVEQIANAGWGTNNPQTLSIVDAETVTVSGVYAVNPGSEDNQYPFAAPGLLMVMGRTGVYATHFLMRQRNTGADGLYIRQYSAGTTTKFERVWTSFDFTIQNDSRDTGGGNSIPTLMRVGAFGWGTTDAPAGFTDPEQSALPTGVYRDLNSDPYNPPNRSTILCMQGFSDSQVFLAIERNSGRIHTFAQNSLGETAARWLTSYDQDNANQPVSFDESLGLPNGGIIEAGGNRDTGWYIKFLDGTLVCGIHRATMVYQSPNALRLRFDYPVYIAQTLAIIPALLDPWNFNGTQYSAELLSASLSAPVQRFKGNSYCNLQVGPPSMSDKWSADDELRCDVVVWGRWRGALETGDSSGGSQ